MGALGILRFPKPENIVICVFSYVDLLHKRSPLLVHLNMKILGNVILGEKRFRAVGEKS